MVRSRFVELAPGIELNLIPYGHPETARTNPGEETVPVKVVRVVLSILRLPGLTKVYVQREGREEPTTPFMFDEFTEYGDYRYKPRRGIVFVKK
ncbi:MAG: hypothetical protein JSW08_01580 [archaeon]|nr:MAG: hypothetical protein JSW08_01580 [archaeon]